MKGQRLFVRPLAAADLSAIEALHTAAAEPMPAALLETEGLVGRLAGSTVAYLTWRRERAAMVITSLFVAADFRGLRIGRLFLTEAEALARSGGATSLRVEQGCKLERYFALRGFVSVEESLTRTIR